MGVIKKTEADDTAKRRETIIQPSHPCHLFCSIPPTWILI